MTDDIQNRLQRGDERFKHIDQQLGALADQMEKVVQQSQQTAETVNEMKEILEGWRAVKTFGKFAKWLGGVIVGVSAGYAALRLGLLHFLGK